MRVTRAGIGVPCQAYEFGLFGDMVTVSATSS